ncbi:NAD(P)H-dependent oxidoreductase [Caldibacillus lycopersici]|uniref:NAD(P)H-dependent oxidoreductase n=1 Tax=Perspicuibacillus lycopersici TaxID=1325689 RepID=A0AAE3IUR2_9BACI|nr:NAD(P)H-dependent oxidoreductase [Perspicuibacillus lycopersici]MCU9614963.1 NAD(P)H-dependent oxidoreductase [Perspicuibacillus lycopersici]
MEEKVIKRKEILAAFQFRHATKAFDPNKKISDEDFQLILEAARLSPSSCGYEPWKFLVIQKPELREEIRKHAWGAQGQAPTASHFVVILARTMMDVKYDSEYVRNQMINVHGFPPEVFEAIQGRYKTFQEHDLKLLESERTMLDWASKQTYIALANMMTTAALLGIDSCPMEGFDMEKIQEILTREDLLENGRLAVSVMVAFGYRANDPKRPKTRKSIQDIVQWIE